MKKLNNKQIEWGDKMAFMARRKLQFKFLIILGILFTGFFAGAWAMDPQDDNIAPIAGTGGVTIATVMGAVGNVDGNPANTQRVGKQLKAKLYILSEDQWDESSGFPSPSGRQIANIPLLSGEYWHYIKTIKNTPELKWVGEEGEIASNINKDLTFVLGGMGDATFNLLEQGIGQGFFIVIEFCSTGTKYLLGNGCKPMVLSSFDGGITKDNTSTLVSFKNTCGIIAYDYQGTTATQAADTVAQDATTITLTSNPQYQLTDGSASAASITGFTATTASDVGRIVTILGSGGSYPSTIDDGNDFLLIDGTTWTANTGAQISFKIFKDGAASYKYVEVAGSRVTT